MLFHFASCEPLRQSITGLLIKHIFIVEWYTSIDCSWGKWWKIIVPRGEIQPLPIHRGWGDVTAYLMLGRTETHLALSICVKIKKRLARYDVTSILKAGLSLYILTFDYRGCWAPSSIDSGNKSLFVKTVWKVSKKFRKCGLFHFPQVLTSFTQVLHLKSLPLF